MAEKWIEKYYDLVLSDKFQEAIGLKRKRCPKSLFKYSKVDKHIIKNLGNDKLCLTNPTDLNDPWEARFYVDYNKLEITEPKFLSDETKEHIKHEQFTNALYKKVPTDKHKQFHKLMKE